MQIVNLTPHAVSLLLNEFGTTLTIAPEPTPARVGVTNSAPVEMDGIPVPVQGAPIYGQVEGLPAEAPGTIYIVSGIVLAQAIGRTDVFAPATGPNDNPIRNAAGQIVAVTLLNAAPKA